MANKTARATTTMMATPSRPPTLSIQPFSLLARNRQRSARIDGTRPAFKQSLVATPANPGPTALKSESQAYKVIQRRSGESAKLPQGRL